MTGTLLMDLGKNVLKMLFYGSYLIRSSIFYNKTSKIYTKKAFEEKQADFQSFDSVNVHDHYFLITGATGDIGRSVCEYLLKKNGVTLYIICREAEEIKYLEKIFKPLAKAQTKLSFFVVDLSETIQVKNFIDDFIKKNLPLNTLILCASEFDKVETKNSAGIERCLAVNVLSTYLLVSLFSEYMSKRPTVNIKNRIIICVCGCLLNVDLHFFDLELKNLPFNPLFYFSHTLKQMAGIAYIFSQKYFGIQYSSVIPGDVKIKYLGWVNTTGGNKKIPDILLKFKDNLRTPEQGADSVLWSAVSDEALHIKSGQVVLDRKEYYFSYINFPPFMKQKAADLYLSKLEPILEKSLSQTLKFSSHETSKAEKSIQKNETLINDPNINSGSSQFTKT